MHLFGKTLVWSCLAGRPCKYCNYLISACQSLKFSTDVSWCVLFPTPQTRPNLDFPRESYDNFSNRCWFLDYAKERGCTTCHVSLFMIQTLKFFRDKLWSVIKPLQLESFNLDLPRLRYEFFPKVTCLKLNSGRGKYPIFLRS